jgi:hypothetical protein
MIPTGGARPRATGRAVVRSRVRPALVAVGVLAVLVSSHELGRAEPTNNYRPDLPPDALATGCFPLPGGAELDLAYQIRRDGDVLTSSGSRRRLLGQYDLVDRDEAERRILAAFVEVGFREVRSAAPDAPVLLRGPDATDVRVTVTELPDTDAGTLVRGEFLLDLPVVAAGDAEVCQDPKSTKRWAS